MKFNTTSLTCLQKPNTHFLAIISTHLTSQTVFKFLSNSVDKSLLSLKPWFKKNIKTSQVFKLNFLKLNQSFKLLNLTNSCYYVTKKKHSMSAIFIRSNLSPKMKTVNYLKTTPTINNLIKLFLIYNSLNISQFSLYSMYFYNYLQLVLTTNLIKPTFLVKNNSIVLYKNLFTRNLLSL